MIFLNIEKICNQLEKIISSSNIKIKEEMKKHTSFKIGGIADILVVAETIEDVKGVLLIAKENNIPLVVIGNGSNLLVKDNGIRGIVLKINLQKINIQKDMQDVEMTLSSYKVAEDKEIYRYDDNVIVEVEAGVKLGKLARNFIKRRN